MPNSATMSASLAFTGPNSIASKTLSGTGAPAVAGNNFVNQAMTCPFSAAAAIPLSNLASLGLIMIINRDLVNYIEILTGTGGLTFAKIKAGEFLLLRCGSDVTAPFWKANTANCEVELMLLET